ncbi:cysteine synthase [Roseivirga seohaensis subsp. aquiponti]|uniref:N-(2-amino-2-carboxyethyl)-L-glutamate synthase n=1 Tax=Roseivirga seohaensis subsp. aquiponti TaxID=1566026 RepID=A0A0L8AIP6_9BACT|nr:2,3-diaminopropionate biosynthesis protein SbnA [Roseivirga seohaensis]KOF02308.1 cysteine synthase [Roseivirga seohaensis subsp. aquiponti]
MTKVNAIHNSILETIGDTPIVKLNRLFNSHKNVFAKMEGHNPGGSIKDRTAIQLLEHAFCTGELKEGDHVIESSSGNMAIGLAQACLYYGLSLTVVVDTMANKHTLKILKAYGANIDMVKEPAPLGGFLTARLNRVQALVDKTHNSFWPNQYGNPQNPLAHKQTMKEILDALDGKLDYMFAATSTCGTLMGCANYILDNNLDTKIIAVDAVGSVIFGDTPQERKIPGHGAGRPSTFLCKSIVDDVIHVSDADCVDGCRNLLNKEAILCGGSSGAVVSAVGRYLTQIPTEANCAMILCDRGERYLDTIYNDEWVNDNIFNPQMIAV